MPVLVRKRECTYQIKSRFLMNFPKFSEEYSRLRNERHSYCNFDQKYEINLIKIKHGRLRTDI